MSIPSNPIFDRVFLSGGRGSTPSVSLYNGTVYLGSLDRGRYTGTYDTTTDDFQLILNAITTGAAYEVYQFGTLEYTDSELPSWLEWAKLQNPFHLASQASDSEAETEPHPELWFKVDLAIEGLVPTFPDFNHTSTQDAYTAFEAAGWSKTIPNLITTPLGSNEALYEMRLFRERIPVFNSNNVLLSYDLQFVGVDITTGTRKYSSDELNWHTEPLPDDKWYAEILPNGQWQEHILNPEIITIPVGTTREVYITSSFGHYSASVIRYFDVSVWSLSKIKEILINALYFTTWSQLVTPEAANTIRFNPQMVKLLTPSQIKEMVADLTYNKSWGWLYQINKTDSSIKQGATTGAEPDRSNYSCGVVSLVSNPVMIITQAVSDRTRLYVDNTDGLANNDLLYWGDEVLRVINVAVGGGNNYIEIEVERELNGTTMLTPEQESTTFIYGIVKGKQLRYVAISRTEQAPYPNRYYLSIKGTG